MEGYIEELKQLQELLNSGIITQEEFDEKKKQLLFGSPDKGKTIKTTTVKPFTATKVASNWDLVFNIITITCLVASIVFLSTCKVGEQVYYNNYRDMIFLIISPFSVGDIRTIFAIIEISFLGLALVANIVKLFFKDKIFAIVCDITTFLSIVFGMISGIFNITYGSNYVHACSILQVIFSGVLLIVLISNIIYKIRLRYNNRVQN